MSKPLATKVSTAPRGILPPYLQRYIMSHFSSKFRLCVKTLRNANPWVNVQKWNKLQRIFPARGVGSNEHCVGSMSIGTVHAHSSLPTSWLSDSDLLTKRDMQNMQSGGLEDWNWEPLCYIMCHLLMRKHYSAVSKYYNARKEDRVVDVCLSFLLCLHSVCECADDVSCLREQGAQRYANTYVDRQVGKTIKMLGPSVLIGWTFLGTTPSTENMNTDKYI